MSDIISTVSAAVSLASRLREISKNIEDAEFKNILADLSVELAETKLKVAGLLIENTELKEKLNTLTSATGDLCPSCNNRTYKITSTRPHPSFGGLGCKERQYTCGTCGFSEALLVDP